MVSLGYTQKKNHMKKIEDSHLYAKRKASEWNKIEHVNLRPLASRIVRKLISMA
jgi:hypothetical protein